MEDQETEQAAVDGENNPCAKEEPESQVEPEIVSDEPPNLKGAQIENAKNSKAIETPEGDVHKNVKEPSEPWTEKDDGEEALLNNINSSFVEALCEAEVERNLNDLEDKVKGMLEELEKTSNEDTENLVVEMDINDIVQLRDELDDLATTHPAKRQMEDVDLNDNPEEEPDEIDDSSVLMPLEVELTESLPNETDGANYLSNDLSDAEESRPVEDVPESIVLADVESSDFHSQNEPKEVEAVPTISILESTLKNGKSVEISKQHQASKSTPHTSTNRIAQASTNTTAKSNQIQSTAAPDLIVRYVIQDGVMLELAECPASGTENSHMEFCLQQDSLCNLVSASIESSLTVDTAKQEDQDASLVQHLLLSEPGITSFKVIEQIFKDVKNLSSTEYLYLYAKLHAKCNDINPGTLTTAFDLKRKAKVSENPHINVKALSLAKPVLNKESIEHVEKILGTIDTVTPNELLFLHMALPKGYKIIKDNLRITTICCRPIVSQTIMWLRTHYEEAPGVLTSKPDVFKDYQNFCEKNQIKPCGIPDFGKIIKRIYPKIYHRRQVVKGKTQYFYCGLKRLYQLQTPKLPPLKSKPEVKEISYNCTGCCSVYVYMHNLKYRQLSMKDYLSSTPHESTAKKQRPPKDPDFYKKGDFVNGKSGLVHDPLELLSLSMTDSVQHGSKPAVAHRKKLKESIKEDPPKIREAKIVKPKSRSNGRILKVKFKQYRHPSVKNIMNVENVIVPYELYNTNVNPTVVLNNKELHNWCAANIERFINQISNINIVKNSDSSKLKVKYECCNKTLKVNQYYGEQLRDLKRELENLEIIKCEGSNDYVINYVYPPEQLPDLLELADQYNKQSFKKTLASQPRRFAPKTAYKGTKSKISTIFSAIKNKHKTVEELLEKVDNITVPEQILTRNIDPWVSLDSREVTDWFEERLAVLKNKIENPSVYEEDSDEEYEEEPSVPCEPEVTGIDNTEPIAVQEIEVTSTPMPNLEEDRKRPLSNVDGDEAPVVKKPFHLSDIINATESERPVEESQDCKMTELTCYFCMKEFQNETELQNHCDIHLRCRTCKRRLVSQQAMIDHLVKHCFMNNAKCAPNLILPRIDQVRLVLNKYPGAFDPSYTPKIPANAATNQIVPVRRKITCINRFPPAVLNFNNVNHNIEQILPSASTNENILNTRKIRPVQTYAKSQKSANAVRIKSNTPEICHYQITTNPFKSINEVQNLQQSTSHLKSTISNNFNRIFLLSNNPSSPPPPESSIVYGLYLNNRSGRSSPICLNNFSRVGSDCAMNSNPSCSIAESTNFMQIVETPNTTISQPTYDPPIISDNLGPFEQHQDHSYFQQPVYPMNNDVSALNNGILNGATQQNMHPNSMYDMTFLNNINSEAQPCVNTHVNNVNKVESTNPAPSTMPGPFRIRVKDIRELS